MISPVGSVFHTTGTSRSSFLRTDRVIYRGQTARFGAYANLTWKQSRSYFHSGGTTVLLGSSRDASVLDVGVNYSQPVARGFATLDASISQGLGILGATADIPVAHAPKSEFTAFKLNASWSRSVAVHDVALTFSSSLSSQFTSQILNGVDQITVGGVYAVRGFDRTNLAGDSGYVWRNDLSAVFRVPLNGPAHVLTVKPYVGVDQGYAWSNMPSAAGVSAPEGSLLGGTGGLTFAYGEYNADFSYSESLARADSMATEPGHFYFRVNASF
jgi:hemolysin activation/secretion protein